jgi:hypothetical protein
MTLNLNDAGRQRGFDLIPAGTIATVQMIIRPGGAGEGGWLKRSADGGSEALDCEFTVVDTVYAKRKIWMLLTLNGTTDGHAEAGIISRALLRAIAESAFDIKPNDVSEAAQQKRDKIDFPDFNNLRFIARIFIEKSKDPAYADKNRLEAVTPDQKVWKPVEQLPVSTQMGLPGVAGAVAPTQAAAPGKPAQAIARPAWAAQRQE